MSDQPARARFSGSPVIVGVMPGQNPAVWDRALELAESWSVPLIAAFVDPASYLIEWTPGNQVLPISLDPVLGTDDDTAIAAAQLKEGLAAAAAGYDVDWSLRIIGGDPALALGRLAEAAGASTIIIGARRPGFMAKVDELVSGSLMHRLLTTQTVPVLGIPSPEVQQHFHSHG
ncbi:universal stress protein [Paenarthrobacter sp. PH39-S1]|uniref:universal stress protein n=1 Tax=Paenarthrobacter sp. PH39-S1 TaxID=3046204 RepID=UPI0024BA783C|nr:universal stress protein [Paenarthrobacter sp. PH39-S1]MDJ0356586.1 universal stress protein [Paenarthrobacter sp. PH39-S1]